MHRTSYNTKHTRTFYYVARILHQLSHNQSIAACRNLPNQFKPAHSTHRNKPHRTESHRHYKTTLRACSKSNTILVAPFFSSSQADKGSLFVRLTKPDSRTNSYFCIFMKKSRRLNHIIALLCFMLLSYHTFKQNSRICFILFGFYSKFYQIFIKVRFFMVSAPTFRPKKQQKMFHMKPSKVFRCFT